jgi:hypothetical protein
MTRIILWVALFIQTTYCGSPANYFFPGIRFRDMPLKEINKDSAYKIIKGLKDYRRIFGPTDIYDKVNHFYRSDIDNDKKDELLYYGIINAEGYWTILWKADLQGYRLFGELFGEITGISDSSYLSTGAPGCCGSDYSFANLYRICDDGIDFQRCTMIFNRVRLPDSPPVKKRIRINNEGYALRSQPIIDDKPDSSNMARHGVLNGNTIVQLNKGTAAWITATYADAAGSLWWFLILDNPAEANYNVYKGYKKEKRQICGWIITTALDYQEIRP